MHVDYRLESISYLPFDYWLTEQFRGAFHPRDCCQSYRKLLEMQMMQMKKRNIRPFFKFTLNRQKSQRYFRISHVKAFYEGKSTQCTFEIIKKYSTQFTFFSSTQEYGNNLSRLTHCWQLILYREAEMRVIQLFLILVQQAKQTQTT